MWVQNVTLCQLTNLLSLSFSLFFLEKGPRGEKGSPGEAVVETIRTEVSSLASQSKWAWLSTPSFGQVLEALRLLPANRRCLYLLPLNRP